MNTDVALLAGLTVPELALLRFLDAHRPTQVRMGAMAKQVLDSPGAWVSNAALMDAAARGAFQLAQNDGPNGFRISPGPAFREHLPAPLAWLAVAYDAEVATWSNPKRNHVPSALRSTWAHAPSFNRDKTGPPTGTPPSVAALWWPYGCPIWSAASPLAQAGLIRTGVHEGGWRTGTSTTLATTEAGHAACVVLGGVVPDAEKRIKANAPADLRPGPLRMGALLLWSAEHRPTTGGPAIVVGPEGPEDSDGSDGTARRAAWLANTILVGAYKDIWLVNRRMGLTAH